MASLVKHITPRLPGISAPGRIPGLRMHVELSMFFDRGEVMAAVSAGKRKALVKAALKVRTYAKKSIQKKGNAKRPLRMQVKIAELFNLTRPYSISELYKRREALTRRELAVVTSRFMEAAGKRQSGSPPGTPPYTHVPSSHQLGFRTNIYFGYDAARGSVVVGPRALGNDPLIGALHEHGGTRELVLYALMAKGRPVPVYEWFSTYAKPRPRMWKSAGVTKLAKFPPRPFMRPALEKAVAAGDLAKAFSRVVTSRGSSGASMSVR
jgi:hypothetical protein